MIAYMEARERFFKAVNDRPQDIDLIAHNAAAVMMKGVEWPEAFGPEQISTAVEGFFGEFWRRWEYAKARSTEGSK